MRKFQIFISSTFEDLEEPRRIVIEQILNLGHIPVGMELFQAGNDTQWDYIKRRILECDYYLLIVGDRYGSCLPDGTSYTEREYRYALESGVPLAAFLLSREARMKLSRDRIETNKTKIRRLDEFRHFVESRMVKYWSESYELAAQISSTLPELMRQCPRLGLVPASRLSAMSLPRRVSTDAPLETNDPASADDAVGWRQLNRIAKAYDQLYRAPTSAVGRGAELARTGRALEAKNSTSEASGDDPGSVPADTSFTSLLGQLLDGRTATSDDVYNLMYDNYDFAGKHETVPAKHDFGPFHHYHLSTRVEPFSWIYSTLNFSWHSFCRELSVYTAASFDDGSGILVPLKAMRLGESLVLIGHGKKEGANSMQAARYALFPLFGKPSTTVAHGIAFSETNAMRYRSSVFNFTPCLISPSALLADIDEGYIDDDTASNWLRDLWYELSAVTPFF